MSVPGHRLLITFMVIFLIPKIYVCVFWIKLYILYATARMHSLAQYSNIKNVSCRSLVSVQFHTYFIYCSGVISWIFFSFCCCINSLSVSYTHKRDKGKNDHFSRVMWAKQVLMKYCFKNQFLTGIQHI